jgi:uncharacterized protein (DUF302 family)
MLLHAWPERVALHFRQSGAAHACNPSLAHEALEDKLGVLLPCNVIVHEKADRRVEVASVDPVAVMERAANPALARIALEVRGRLARVVDGVAS